MKTNIDILEQFDDKKINKVKDTAKGKAKAVVSDKRVVVLAKTAAPYLAIFAACIILFNVILEISVIPSESMEPTIYAKDFVIFSRLAYRFSDIERGDIVTLFDNDGQRLCKRIIGLPGDHIEFDSGYVYINGEKLDENYLPEDTETNAVTSFDVPKDKYFVLGDNREVSYDSRFWANPYIDKKHIISKYLIVFSTHTLKK